MALCTISPAKPEQWPPALHGLAPSLLLPCGPAQHPDALAPLLSSRPPPELCPVPSVLCEGWPLCPLSFMCLSKSFHICFWEFFISALDCILCTQSLLANNSSNILGRSVRLPSQGSCTHLCWYTAPLALLFQREF